MPNKEKYRDILKNNDLRVTPQRLVVLETFMSVKNHPSAEELSEHIKREHPNISTATIYNILESFVNKGILSHVKTDKGAMIYDSVTKHHHHIYDINSTIIKDYHDEKLDLILKEYFNQKKIDGIEIKEISLQILGNFTKQK